MLPGVVNGFDAAHRGSILGAGSQEFLTARLIQRSLLNKARCLHIKGRLQDVSLGFAA